MIFVMGTKYPSAQSGDPVSFTIHLNRSGLGLVRKLSWEGTGSRLLSPSLGEEVLSHSGPTYLLPQPWGGEGRGGGVGSTAQPHSCGGRQS